MFLKTLNPKQKRQYINILIVFIISVIIMWFGVFKLHIYDAAGDKRRTGIFILGVDWFIIAISSFTIVKSYFSTHRGSSYKSLPSMLRFIYLLATITILASILVFIVTAIYWIFILLALKNSNLTF